MRVSDVARRSRGLAVAAAGLAAALGLALPAAAARATTAGYTPSPSEWWMANWHVPQQAWPLSEGAGVTVGVVDTGVQASIPDLRGVVLRGADTLRDSGNGDRDFASSQDGHGTVVAALIAGQGRGGGPVGIAPRAKILPVHASDPNGSVQSVAAGIKYAAQHGAKVINISLAATAVPTPTSCDPVMQDAVAYALSRNGVVVAGSGDTNKEGPGPIEPASCAGVLTVGGIEPNGSLWPDSTRQPYVSVAAPSDHIFVVGMDGRTGTSGAGTSYSAPLVAGAAALIRSRYPSMPWYQVDQRIIDTAIAVKPVPNDGYGYGIMDVSRAVNTSAYPVSTSSPNPPYTRYLAWLKSPDGQSWAKANGVTAPSSGSSAGGSGPSAGAAPSATAKSGSGGSATLIIAVVVVIVVLAGIVLALVARSRSGRGPRNPGRPRDPGGPGAPGGGYPTSAYTQPPSTEPPGQYPRGGPQRS
jgi:type VII secretion-associated serine protease mycosin